MARDLTGNAIKKQTFVQGAAIIAAAHIMIKFIGAAYKIPLDGLILKTEGMGIYGAAYTIYNWMFMISTAGLPVAVSKMVAESAALRNYADAKKIFSISRGLMFIIGLCGSAVLFFGASMFAEALAAPSAKYTIMTMAPSLFFVAMMSSYRGFFQGLSNMTPTAISEVIEALGKLVVGITLALAFIGYGVQWGAAGAIGGVTIGTVLGLIALLVYSAFARRKLPEFSRAALSKGKSCAVVRTGRQILKQLVYIAIPITLGVSVFTLTSLIDTAMVMNLLKGLGHVEAERLSMYGYLLRAITMFNMPPTIISAIAISVVPAIASALALGNKWLASETAKSALRITILISVPCAVGLCVLASPILRLLYHDSGYYQLLNIMGLAVAMVTIVQVGNAILQANGRVWTPVLNMLVGGFVKIFVNYTLVGNPAINIYGAPVGTFLCYFTVAVLNLIAIKRITGIKYEAADFLIRPLASGIVMGVATDLTYKFVNNALGNYIIAMGAAMVAAAGIYFAMLFLVRAVKKEDVLLLPKGKYIYAMLQRARLMK